MKYFSPYRKSCLPKFRSFPHLFLFFYSKPSCLWDAQWAVEVWASLDSYNNAQRVVHEMHNTLWKICISKPYFNPLAVGIGNMLFHKSRSPPHSLSNDTRITSSRDRIGNTWNTKHYHKLHIIAIYARFFFQFCTFHPLPHLQNNKYHKIKHKTYKINQNDDTSKS